MDTISKLKEVLDRNLYLRKKPDKVIQAFRRLDVKAPKIVEEFFMNFEGPFWEETLGMDFLDIVEDRINIETITNECRKTFSFPMQYLVLTTMVALEVIVLDTLNDKVYRVNFEGGDEKLLNGELQPEWNSFEDFLVEYFEL